MDVNILKYLDKQSIIIGVRDKSKRVILSDILESLISNKKLKAENKKEVLKTLLQREDMGSTAIGGYIALPHARVNCVKELVLTFVISYEGVEFDSLDQEKVHVLVLILSNQKDAGLHLKMLAFLAKMLRDKYFVQQLKNSKTETEIYNLVNKQSKIVI